MNNMETTTHLVGYSKHSRQFIYDEQRHGLDTYLFRLQTEGNARALIGGQMNKIVAGDLLLYKPGDPYELQVETVNSEGIIECMFSSDFYVFCSGPWIDDWWGKSHKPSKINIPLDNSLVPIWWEFTREQSYVDNLSQQIMGHFLKTLCLKIERVLIGLESKHTKKDNFISYRMRNYIEENISHPFTVEAIANYVGLSESRTAHLFKENFGISIIQYTLDLRLKLAVQQMLVGSAPLEVIAENCGFQSYSYFHRQFRAKYTKSPKEYRLQHR